MYYNETVNSNIPNSPIRFHPPGEKELKGPVFNAHFHNEIEILYVRSGIFTAYNDSVSVSAKAGEIIFINSRVVHATRSEIDGTSTGLTQFDVSEIFRNHMQNVSKYFQYFLSSSETPMYCFKKGDKKTDELNQYINEILSEISEKKTAYEMYVKSSICKILGLLYRYGIIQNEGAFFNSETVERILPALNYIDNNYQKEIKLDDLSKITNFNPNYFCRIFKKATNSSFTEYLNFVRVYKAEKLIVEGKNTISEIASLVGFSSLSYFNRIFKRYKGCTPSVYKKVKYAIQ